jgi:hypothetical protein
MIFLAALTVALGLGAGLVWKILCAVAMSFLEAPASTWSSLLSGSWGVIRFPETDACLRTPVIMLALGVGMTAVYAFVRLAARQRPVIVGRTWDCGYYRLDHRTEYTATAFSKPFRIAFGFFLLPYRKTEKIWDSFYHVKEFTYETATTPVFKRYLYGPVVGGLFKLAQYVRGFQMGSIHWYLAYIFVTLWPWLSSWGAWSCRYLAICRRCGSPRGGRCERLHTAE